MKNKLQDNRTLQLSWQIQRRIQKINSPCEKSKISRVCSNFPKNSPIFRRYLKFLPCKFTFFTWSKSTPEIKVFMLLEIEMYKRIYLEFVSVDYKFLVDIWNQSGLLIKIRYNAFFHDRQGCFDNQGTRQLLSRIS